MKYKSVDVQTLKGFATISMRIADGFISRMLGLFAGKKLIEGEAIYLSPCNAIHTIGMLYCIDVLFLDASNRIVKIEKKVKKWSFRHCKQARSTVEMLAGEVDRLGIFKGGRFVF